MRETILEEGKIKGEALDGGEVGIRTMDVVGGWRKKQAELEKA